MTSAASSPIADRTSATILRGLLEQAGYTRDGIQAAIGGSGDILTRRHDRPVARRRIAGRHAALETLVRLFVLDDPVPVGEAAAALAPTSLEVLANLGIVDEVDGALWGLVRIVPHGDVVIASDLPPAPDPRDGAAATPRRAVRADHVPGLHRPSITLADLTVRRHVGSALDVGTGNGIQALLAARHSDRVVATDINERALAFAALNAAINGRDNIEFRAGSFFEPVAGERFELIVCNPPYVISPEMAYVFRDSGLGRDRVSEALVAALPEHLEEGGFGTLMASWIQDGDGIPDRPRAWLSGRSCDAWVLHTGVEDPLTVAAEWNRDEADREDAYAAAIDRWVAYFRDEAIGAIAYGAIVMRRRTPSGAGNWFRSRELPPAARTEPGAHVLRLFTGVDGSIAHATDDALGELRLALVPGATIGTELRREPDGWAEAFELTLALGIPFTAELDRFTAEFLGGLDGQRSLEDVLRAFAHAHDAPLERVRPSGLRLARTILEAGFAEATEESRTPR